MQEVELNDWQVMTLYHYYLKHKELWKRIAEYLSECPVEKGESLSSIKRSIFHDMENTYLPCNCYGCLCVRVDIPYDIKNIFSSQGIHPTDDDCGDYCIVDWGLLEGDECYIHRDCDDRYIELQRLVCKGLDSFRVLRAVDLANEIAELPFRYQKRLEQIEGYDPELL